MKQPFEKVVAEHGATVLRVCRAVVGVHDADDAWSETFLAALGAWPELPDDANVEAWLVTIAHRKAIDVTRMRQRLPLADASPDAAVDAGSSLAARPERASGAAATHPGGARRTHEPGHPAHDDALDLWQAVGALPEKQRLAVAYHYLGGLPFVEVAALVGGSVEAARRASSDGVRALRARYAAAGAPASTPVPDGVSPPAPSGNDTPPLAGAPTATSSSANTSPAGAATGAGSAEHPILHTEGSDR